MPYEFGSILKFVETTFGLGQLTASDARANSLDDCFDFSQVPPRFSRVRVRYSPKYFEQERPSEQAPDND